MYKTINKRVYQNMKLNPKKCKEMIVSFRRDIEQPPPTLVVENISFERIESHKVLGLTIQNNLKWDLHISEIYSNQSIKKTAHLTSSQAQWSFTVSFATSIFCTY